MKINTQKKPKKVKKILEMIRKGNVDNWVLMNDFFWSRGVNE